MITKSSTSPLLRIWASRGSPNAVSRNYWRANLEGRRLGGPPNQNFLPPPPPKSPPHAPQPPSPPRTEQPDPKRRREPKGKEAHRPTKQLKISNAPSQGLERGEVQQPQPQAWLPAPMLGGKPLVGRLISLLE